MKFMNGFKKLITTFTVATLFSVVLISCAAEGSVSQAPGLGPGEIRMNTKASDGEKNSQTNEHSLQDGSAPENTDDGVSNDSSIKQETPQNSEKDIPGRGPIETEKKPFLPSSFPSNIIPLAYESTVIDAGERSGTEWFVVLEFRTIDDANTALYDLVEKSNLTIVTTDEGTDGGYVWDIVKNNQNLSVVSTEYEKSAILSIDISQSL